MLREIKIAMIGGGGKNIGGTILYLLNSGRVQNIEFALFGRTYKNMERNIALANRIKNHNGCSIKVYDTLESALEGADIVMHCATAGYGEGFLRTSRSRIGLL
jgi:alpha-galactosidase/6-phospho-beta-glucosidase family protein